MSLSEEQIKRIEFNRAKAQELRRQRLAKVDSQLSLSRVNNSNSNAPQKSSEISQHAVKPNDATIGTFSAHCSSITEYNRQRALELRRRKVEHQILSTNKSDQSNDVVYGYVSPSVSNSTHQPTDCYSSKTTPNVHQPTLTKANVLTNSGSQESSHSMIQMRIEENRKKALALRAQRNTHATDVTQHTEKDSTRIHLLSKPKESKATIDPPAPVVPYNGPVHLARCCLKSTSRFYVETKFHTQLIAVIKQMPSRQYDTSSNRWSLKIEEHDSFLKSTKFLEPQVKISPLPKFISSCLKQQNRQNSSISASNPLAEKLLPFQHSGVEFALSLGGRALIADDMGLGKTIQAICVMQEYRSEWPVLVICPSSLRLTWSEAFTSWLDDVNYSDINVLLKGNTPLGKEKVTIVSYDLLNKFDLEGRFKCAIADESHFIKNGKTVRCKAAVTLLNSVKRCLLLSGTPALSRPIELFTQLQCINKKLMPSYQEFGLRYCDGKKTNFGWDFTGNSNLDELHIFMSANFMIRRLKKDVLDQLPGKRRKKIIIETKMSKKLNTAAANASNASKTDQQASFFEYYGETAEAKLPGVTAYISELVESEKKFLVFFHHKTMYGGLAAHLRSLGVRFISIDGDTPSDKRQQLVDTFQTESSCLVAMLSITAANTGFTLTAADTVVFAELFYNPGILQQAEDRVHRIGQKNSVVIHYLVARKTSDDKMWPMIETKLSVLGGMGVGSGDFKDTENSDFKYGNTQESSQSNIMQFFSALQPSNKRPRLE